MFGRTLIFAFLTILTGCVAAPEPFKPTDVARISMTAVSDKLWTVVYVLPKPVSELVFVRQPDGSRVADWVAGPGFEIVQVDGLERIRSTDKRPFTEATFAVPPLYRDLPKDYAPFSPFGDGGLLAYTGRFFACPGECPADATWQMMLAAPGRTILTSGQSFSDEARWREGGDGQNVYVGKTQPVATADFLAVIDTALPEKIRGQLSQQLPQFMRFFAERMGNLDDRPMLFASYDLSHQNGMGRQGGTLPGQVFVHFYGAGWPDRMSDSGFTDELAWHFAHEAAHLYQRQLFADTGRGAWIHEGGAEAMAAIALSLNGRGDAVRAHVAALAEKCGKILGSRSIHDALDGRDFDAAYACGLQVNLTLDAELRQRVSNSDGIFTVWRRYLENATSGTATEADFLTAIEQVGGVDLSTRIAALVSTPQRDFPAANLPTANGKPSW